MSLPSPNLDDRSFDQLVEQAKALIREKCPAWNDLSPNDPGMVLVEVFAYLTEALIYRLNRLPEKAYLEFLNLMGVKMRPPAAAQVELLFRRTSPGRDAIVIPANIPVSMSRAGGGGEPPPLFYTVEEKTLEADADAIRVLAIHGVMRAESVGAGTGNPGVCLRVRHAPIVAALQSDRWDLELGVEFDPRKELPPASEIVDFGLRNGKRYRLWREVESFAHTSAGDRVFVLDRARGHITFAPALDVAGWEADVAGDVADAGDAMDAADAGELDSGAADEPKTLGAVPPAGQDIAVRYYSGGGSSGNKVPGGALTVLKQAIAGVEVTNPEVSSGGRDMETFENVLKRGPLEMRSLERAITATDYEQVAENESGIVNRARAFTQVDLWQHAVPGTVEVFLVPALPQNQPEHAPVTTEGLRGLQGDGRQLERVHELLEQRRAIGTRCVVRWADCKSVQVKARVVVQKDQSRHGVKERVAARLNRSINPMRRSADAPGWRFGNTLHVSHVFDICLSEPGVSYLDNVVLAVDRAPDGAVAQVEADCFQRGTWFATCRNYLYRSQNDGFGWELVGEFPLPGEQTASELEVRLVAASRHKAGLVATGVAELHEGRLEQYRIYFSSDCGATWRNAWNPNSEVHDMAWIVRDGVHILLLATDDGLFEIGDVQDPKGWLVPLRASAGNPPVLAVEAVVVMGVMTVAVAAGVAGSEGGGGGVFLSRDGGKRDTFRGVSDSKRKDIRSLAFHRIGSRTWLYAGVLAIGTAAGNGCLRWELTIKEEGLVRETEKLGEVVGWKFGSCYDLSPMGSRMYAGTFRGGVVSIDGSAGVLKWQAAGEPKNREDGRIVPVRSIATTPDSRSNAPGRDDVLLAAMDRGIYHSLDGGERYAECSQREFREQVTIPDTWLFCSGAHEVEVIGEEQADPGQRGFAAAPGRGSISNPGARGGQP